MSGVANYRHRLEAEPFEPFPITSVGDPGYQFWIDHPECVTVWELDQGLTVVDENDVQHKISAANLPEMISMSRLPLRIRCKRHPDASA